MAESTRLTQLRHARLQISALQTDHYRPFRQPQISGLMA